MLYRLARPLLFKMDPERAHELVVAQLEALGRRPRLLGALTGGLTYEDPILETEAWGLSFPNPLGLAAGFDKDARLAHVMPHLGFGHVEVGTVTREPQEGNPRPRLFRYSNERALVNRMGFNNEGADAVARRLAAEGRPNVPLGINVGKSKVAPLDGAEKDYLGSFEKLQPLADYLVVNVSSPNTPGLRVLQGRERLSSLLGALQAANKRLAKASDVPPKPLLVKVAPELTAQALDEVVDVALEHGLNGIIATNTTTARRALPAADAERGGLSGAPLRDRATAVVAHLHQAAGDHLTIVGVGGVLTADDALEKIEAGAGLVQLYTGFVYGGPGTAARINRGLAQRLRQAGYGSVAEAVGRRAHRHAL